MKTSRGTREVIDRFNQTNAARRLSQWLKMRKREQPPQGRTRRLIIEPMEPRFLLSGEGLVLPPAHPAPDASQQPVITTPHDILLSQLTAANASQMAAEPAQTTSATTRPEGQLVQHIADGRANEIVFVDAVVQDRDALLQAALGNRLAQNPNARFEVVYLDPNSDGVSQITYWLQQYHDLSAIHIISHGGEASLLLGTTTLDSATLDGHHQELASWGAALAPGADLLLYGCDVAVGAQGGAFLNTLSQWTGADVAASTDASGNPRQGGNWVLEKATGTIETVSLSDPDYHHLLAAVTPSKSGATTTALSATTAFTAATRLGTQLDASSDLAYTMPMADISFGSLLQTNDGRTLGDILSFKTTANTTVFDDYLAQASSPTMGGLMDRLGDYLNGTGAYSNLESWVDHAAGTPAISLTATASALTVDLTLSRQFIQHFGFNAELKPLGFDFQTGEGIPLVADVHYKATYDFGSGTIAVDTLDAQVKAATATVNAGAVLGILDVTASGTVVFDTGKVAFASIGAQNTTQILAPGEKDYVNLFTLQTDNAPEVKANMHFDLTGSVGTTPLATLAGGTPHVDVIFGTLSLDSDNTPALLPTLTGTATLGSGQTLEVVVGGATYAVTPADNGSWSLDLSTHPVATSGTLVLANNQTYVTTASIKQAGIVQETVAGTVTINSTLPKTTITSTDFAAEAWSDIQKTPMTVTAACFSQVQAFASLNSTQLVKMLQDLGSYLTLLRDSGQFDAVLPFTALKLGNALDFSAAINDVINNQLATTLVSGITASQAISPVLARNVSFDLYLQRPEDDRVSTLTITVDKAETLSFVHINQLAELIGQKIATAVNGWLAWPGDNFDVAETLKGGQTLDGADKTSEEQTLQVHAAAGSYQLQLGDGGTKTGAISVLASPIEVQNALESVLGAGNVIVTGRPKQYRIQFTGTLADTDQASLEVVAGADVTTGSLIDVTASHFSQGSDGTVWGQLNFLQANPGEFTVFQVTPSSTVSVSEITPGSDSVEEVQRLTIVHGSGSSFYLSGTNTAGAAFTTAAIAATATTGTIATALAAALPGVTGLSVADVSAEYAADNGTRVFDIGFGKTDATHYGSYAVLTADTTTAGVWTSALPAQGMLATRQQAAAAVGATPAQNEIQRLSLANATGGQYVIGVTLGTLFCQSDPIAWGSTAGTIQAALVRMLQQSNPDISAADCSVTAVAGKSNTFDIEFKGIWAAQNRPQMVINTHGLTSAPGNTYGPLTGLGLLAAGQDMSVNSVTTFNTFMEMMARFQQAVNATLPVGTTFAVDPRFDAPTKSLLFDCKLAPAATVQAVPLALASSVGALSALSANTTLDLSTAASFQSTIGFDFTNLNTFALRAAGAYTGIITATAQDKTICKLNVPVLGGDAPFSLTFDGEDYDLTLTQASTTTNTTRTDLVADLQGVLNNKGVVAGGVLDRLGFAHLGDLVTAGLSTTGQLQLAIHAPLTSVQLTVTAVSPMNTLLGFQNMTTYPAPKAVTLASNGQLHSTATFKLRFDQTDAVTVTVAPDTSNSQTGDLIADLNAAFAATSVASHTYLGTGAGGLGFTNLGQVVHAILNNSQIEIVTLSPRLASAQILIAGNNAATTELGFTPGQFATTSGAYVFLIDPVLGGQYSAVVHGQSGTTPATLTTPGEATLGMLNLTFNNLWTDYQGSMSFALKNGLAGQTGDHISLNALFDSASSQESLLGMGGALQTSDTVSATAAPYQSNGQLLRDVGLEVTVGSLNLDVVVLRSATLNNTSVNDLAADIDAAIHAALVARLGSDPYAANTFVTISNVGTTSAPQNVLTFTAPTTTLTLAANPTQIYNAATGVLLTDLHLAVTVSPDPTVSPVEVLVRTSRTSSNQSLDDLVGNIQDAIRSALQSAESNTTDATLKTNMDALIAATDLVGKSDTSLTLKNGVVSAEAITLKNFAIQGRLMDGDYMTSPVFLNQASQTGTTPTAILQLSGIGILSPTGVRSTGLDPTTQITIRVSNAAAVLGGTAAMTVVTVVPPNGLGNLTPFKDIAWSSLLTDLDQLGGLLGDLGSLGAFGELGRALPVLGTSVSEVFDFASRFKQIEAQLDGQTGIGLQGLQTALATAFGIDASAITLQNDNTSGQEALRIVIPYHVVVNQSVPIDLLFNDPGLLGLLPSATQVALLGLIGTLRELKDTDETAKCQLHADITFNLALGIDLGSASANKGKLFLYDYVPGGSTGFAGATGTFARLDAFSVTASGMAFQSNQGIYSLGVTGGTATLTLAGTSGLLLQSDAADGAKDGRLYIGAYAALSTTDEAALKKSNFAVIFDGSAAVKLPMTLAVSDELGQLAIEQIDGFINPLPLGTLELNYINLGDSFAAMGGKTGYTLRGTAETTNSPTILSSQVQQAALPERPSTGNGTAVTTPEGAPVDTDNDAALQGVNPDPFYSSTAGAGASTTPSNVTVGAASLFSPSPQANPASTGFDISLIIPNIKYWQQELTTVLEQAIGSSCNPGNPVNGPLLFLLRDPTLVVNTVDKVLETIQEGLDAFSSVLSLPIIGDQLKAATQFVTDLRFNVVKSLKDALSSLLDIYGGLYNTLRQFLFNSSSSGKVFIISSNHALSSSIDISGGLDNTLRMFLFHMLTTDTNHDYIIEPSEVNANPFLNFLQDYNGDGLITPDDIVVEYVAGTGTPEINPDLADYLGVTQASMIPAVLPGQRTAWVTAGANQPGVDSQGNPLLHDDGTPCYTGQAGNVVIDSSLQKILDDVSGAIDSMGETASALMKSVMSSAPDASLFDSLQNVVSFIAKQVANGYNYQSLLRDVFGAGVTAAVMTDVLTTFTPSAEAIASDLAATKAAQVTDPHAVVITASLAELKTAVKEQAIQVGTDVALAQSTAIQFRMHLGQTYTPNLNLGFNIGVPGLSLSLDGGVQLHLKWDLYLGFGIDIKQGFYLITNMPANAGIGAITTYDPTQPGVATGVTSNPLDAHIDNLWLVGKPTFTPAVKELQAQIDVFLAPASSGGPAALNAQLFCLNGTLTDDWDGWIRDNDTGIWGTGTDSMGRLTGTQSATYGRSLTLFDGDTGADGTRTRLQLNLAVDLKDKGLFGISALSGMTDGRLTFNDIRTAKLSDLVAVEWEAKAQVNLHMRLGISLGGAGYLPEIMGDFHMTWQDSNQNKYVQKIEQYFSSGYDTLFHAGTPSIWMTDVYLDVGTFFSQFLKPIVSLIQDITNPIMPVITALTTPIPGLSDLMGRDYSAVDLASDMSSLFGGISEVDFIVAMVNMLDVIDHLPTNTAGLLIPVSQVFVVSGSKDRKINLAALPAIPGLPNLDVPVSLPYKTLADVAVNQGGLEFSLNMGVGWKTDTTLLTIFKGDMPAPSFDFSLNADVKVPAPYVDVTPVDFTIDGIVGTFKLNIKAGWQDLHLSDILSGAFVPRFDVTVELPTGFDINTKVLPVLKILLPKIQWSVGSKTWVWASGAEYTVNWPDAIAAFVDPNKAKTINLTGASFDVNLGHIDPFLPQIKVMWPTVRWSGLGMDFQWTQTDSTTLGWSSIISDSGLLAALVDPNKTIIIHMPDVWLPSISLADLLPNIDFNLDFGLPSLPSLPSIHIDLPDINMPGQQTVSPGQAAKQALSDFQNKLKKPGSALQFPILDDPVGSVIAMLTGQPADLITFTPHNLNLKVGFRVSYPIYPPLYVGLGGNINIKVMLTLGFDTYGIGEFFKSHNVTDILDGFYLSDNIVNGVDLPEITLNAKL
ncbi:MAG: DUF4347 domain-containing protein, partial [Magnetococcales bacterium]|nr:DUF4347 domain-containing protein [Magnetococcales bacterium]